MIENKSLALERLSNWKQKGATLLFAFSAPNNKFTIRVEVRDVSDESLMFQWVLNASDAQGAFVISNGHFVVRIEHAVLFVSDDSGPAVTFSHGDFRCTLTVIRASAFAG
jgi:hypothetical protein